MKFDFSLFFMALGLAFVLEASLWLLFPARMREAMQILLSMADSQLRTWGTALLLIGLALCAVGRFLIIKG